MARDASSAPLAFRVDCPEFCEVLVVALPVFLVTSNDESEVAMVASVVFPLTLVVASPVGLVECFQEAFDASVELSAVAFEVFLVISEEFAVASVEDAADLLVALLVALDVGLEECSQVAAVRSEVDSDDVLEILLDCSDVAFDALVVFWLVFRDESELGFEE